MLAPPHRIPLFPIFRVVLVLASGAFLVLATSGKPSPAVACAPAASAPIPALWATDIAMGTLGEGLFGEAVRPFPGQKRPPCVRGVEVDWAGACWIPHEVRPPCPPGLYEGAGRCLVPVKAEPRPPTSVHQ
jgi:hypothetical protein